MTRCLPRILIVDDVYGRAIEGEQNHKRRAICDRLKLKDITPLQPGEPAIDVCKNPIAEACFVRGQIPVCARLGDNVVNSIEQVLQAVDSGWNDAYLGPDKLPWSLVMVDLCFYQGKVTEASESAPGRGKGMPQGNTSDMNPEKYFGLDILREIHRVYSTSDENEDTSTYFDRQPVIVVLSEMTQEPTLKKDIEKLWSRDFLSSTQATENDLREILNNYKLIPSESDKLLGISKAWLLTAKKVRQAALQNRNILLLGERGTGKSTIAKWIHEISPQKNNFRQFNCAAISPSLTGSALFGSIKGAFTGSFDRKGYFEAAHGGTLFIDEVGEMSQEMQSALLSVLEDQKVTRVGDTNEKDIDVRLITATSKDLLTETAEGRFNPALFDRIKPVTIRIPPLRERTSDIPLFAKAFARTARVQSSEDPIDDTARKKLESYSWPGNIRELRACIERALSEFPEVSCLRAEHIVLPHNSHSSNSVMRKRVNETITSSTDSEEKGPELLSAYHPNSVSTAESSRQTECSASSSDDRSDRNKLDGALYRSGCSLAEILHDAFEATRNRTPKNPEGYSVARAMNLIYEGHVPASGPEARRRLKRICKIVEEIAPGSLAIHGFIYSTEKDIWTFRTEHVTTETMSHIE